MRELSPTELIIIVIIYIYFMIMTIEGKSTIREWPKKIPQSSNLLTQRRLIGSALSKARDKPILSHLSSTISCTNERIKKWPFQLFTWTNNKKSSRYPVSAHNLTPLVVATAFTSATAATEGAFGELRSDRLRRLSSSECVSCPTTTGQPKMSLSVCPSPTSSYAVLDCVVRCGLGGEEERSENQFECFASVWRYTKIRDGQSFCLYTYIHLYAYIKSRRTSGSP